MPAGIYTVWLEGHSGNPYFQTRRYAVPAKIGGAVRDFSLGNSTVSASIAAMGGTAAIPIYVSTTNASATRWGAGGSAVTLGVDAGSFTDCSLDPATIGAGQLTFSTSSVTPTSSGSGAQSTLTINSVGLAPGCYRFNVRAYGTNGDGQPVVHIQPITFTVATSASSGSYVDIIGFGVFQITDINSNAISGRAVSGIYPDPTDQIPAPCPACAASTLVTPKESTVVELEYSDKNSKRSKVYLAFGLLMALMVAGIVFVALQASSLLPQDDVVMREVVVAARDIPGRKPIEEGDLVMRSVVADATNDSAMTRIDEVLGRVSGVTILTGQMLTQNMLASSTQGQAYSILEPGQEFDPSGPDLRAVSVSVPDDRAVAGTLVPGQLVDLIVTMAINPEIGQTAEQAEQTQSEIIPGPSTKVTLQSMTILARNGGLYILRTDLATAEKVAELTAAGGQFTFVLRPDVDDRLATTAGSTIDTLIDEFGFPVPKPPVFEDRNADR